MVGRISQNSDDLKRSDVSAGLSCRPVLPRSAAYRRPGSLWEV